MNNKGFTLVELLATIVVLAIIAGISFVSLNVFFGKAKENTEEVFVDTIKDAMDIYLDSDGKSLDFNSKCSNQLSKKHGLVDVYKASDITFNDVINSKYKPITKEELVNPANEDIVCNVNALVSIYRDDDGIYYYKINKSDFDCLKNIGIVTEDGDVYSDTITNLPEGYECN